MRIVSFTLSLLLSAQPLAVAELPEFDTEAPGYPVAIESIYDGDTYTVAFQPTPVVKAWVQEKIRLFDVEGDKGINTPEIRGIQKPQGLISKLWVQEQIAASPEERLLTDGDRGKYGRLLGDISYHCHPIRTPSEWCSLARELVRLGLGETREY